MIPSGYLRNLLSFRLSNLLPPGALFLLLLFFPFSLYQATLLATEKQPVIPQKTALNQTKSVESFVANAEKMIEELIVQLEQQNENNWEKIAIEENQNPTSLVSSIPNIKPLNGSITSTFGLRIHPVYNLPLFHQGIDISASTGTHVQTTGDGIVAFAGGDKGYGQMIAVNHGYGYKTIYAHLSKLMVRQGQKVSRGDIIALSGNTGTSTGPHLHYEVQKNNVKVNPTTYFFNETNTDKFTSTINSSPEKSDNHL